MTDQKTTAGAYGAQDDIVDYILGITFEIWEARGIELIDQYYDPETTVYALDGITHGAAEAITGTRNMLVTFPDRLLLGDDVITSGDCVRGYSSHRVLSPATNTGDSIFGSATGRHVRFMNMADCVVEDAVVTLEWLARDNFALVEQLGFDPLASARIVASRRTSELDEWFVSEAARVASVGIESDGAPFAADGIPEFARGVLGASWVTGDQALQEAAYAPYAVAHRSPVHTLSGRKSVINHYAALRSAFSVSGLSVDHTCVQKWGERGYRVAVRWAIGATHVGEYQSIAPTDKPVFVFGVTHWRIVEGRIVSEWTVFDTLAVMGQLV